MLRSMYSGISGLKNFQTKLDVIGNNIANVNTYGFKKGRVIFKDLMSQTQTGASGPGINSGGINTKQVGLGAEMAAIDTIHGAGSRQTTGRILDLSIEGEGFFMVAEAPGTNEEEATAFNNIKYTRAGNFYMDQNGYIVNADGYYLVGAAAANGDYPSYADLGAGESYSIVDPDADEAVNLLELGEDGPEFTFEGDGAATPIKIPTTAQSMSISTDGTVSFVDEDGTLRWAGQIITAKFPNAGGLEKVGSNYYQITANSGQPFASVGGEAGLGKVISSSLEMSNVDLSEEFTEMIVAQRGFQANTRIITTSDEILQELVNLKR